MADGSSLLEDLQYAVRRTVQPTDVIQINFGDPAQPAEEDVLPKDFYSIPYSTNGNPYVIKPGDSLSQIAENEYGKDLFYIPDSKISQPFKRGFSTGVPMSYFFPLIVLATFKKSQTDKSYVIDQASPDRLFIGRNLSIPPLDVNKAKDLLGNTNIADIFEAYVTYYQNTAQDHYAKGFMDIANYIRYGSK